MSSTRRPALLLPALAVQVVVASATFLVAKRAVTEIPPLTLALFRFVLAAALLVPLVKVLKPGKRIDPSERRLVWLLGLLGVPLNQGLFLLGIQWASVSHAALLYALTPAIALLIVSLRGGPRPSAAQLGGVTLAFAGVALLLFQRGIHFERNSLLGDLLVFMAVIAWAAYLVIGRDLTRRVGALLVASESLVAGMLIYLPIGLVSLIGFHPSRVSATAWLCLLYLAWLTSAMTYVVWFWGLQYLKTATVVTLTNAQPILAAAMAWLFLREVLPPGFVISTAMVVIGVGLTRIGSEAS